MDDQSVAVWEAPLVLPTYVPDPPSEHPHFLTNRVYQGSSGAVYPMPLYESIATEPVEHAWRAVHLENEWLRLVVLPELGGRIHIGYDRLRDHDFFHRQDVIKPALVGLSGPWIAGGVEFNWPQHHRPGTFLPTDVEIETAEDGSVTVWCSDHDPLTRMKGMHGVRLRPDRAVIEVLARLHNRTEAPQTFLWWANVAARVDENYQSFFPNDVHFVADHANRATTGFPAADRPYYGVDYPARVDAEHPQADRLDWYRNIPVPTSYMVLETEDEFFGGYDHGRKAGFVHWASKEVSPGKKQWTWGDHDFGHAWDRALTDDGGHYIELMAGVFTNNQPDFSFLQPGETKTFSQLWYPIGELGPVDQASPDLAINVRAIGADTTRRIRVGVQATRRLPGCMLDLLLDGRVIERVSLGGLDPSVPVAHTFTVPGRGDLQVHVSSRDGAELGARLSEAGADANFVVPPPATEPLPPEQLLSTDELFFVGSHLEQYRHATRSPELWWQEALRRDPGDFRCNVAMGWRRFRAGVLDEAEAHARLAVARTSQHNLNPRDAEAHYLLGLTLVRSGDHAEARRVLARAAWDGHWWLPAELALAHLDLLARTIGADRRAEERLRTLVQAAPQQLEARNLLVVAQRRLGQRSPALNSSVQQTLDGTLAIDPLDAWARVLAGHQPQLDPVTWLDVAKEFERCGEGEQALAALAAADAAPAVEGMTGVAPLVAHHRAFIHARLLGAGADAVSELLFAAAQADPRWALAIDLDDLAVLTWALERWDEMPAADDTPGETAPTRPTPWLAHHLVASWCQHWRRPEQAEQHWLTSWGLHPTAVVARALGLVAHNLHHDLPQAWQWYERARDLAPDDPALLAELDQLAERRGDDPSTRLARLDAHLDLVARRHDLSIRHAALRVVCGRSDEALAAMRARTFQPWEGGEGQVLATWEAACLASSLDGAGDHDRPERALALIEQAIRPPHNLGEDRHLLANPAHLLLSLGDALDDLGRADEARAAWRRAATSSGDFREMATTEHSDLSFFRVLALRRLGETARADELVADLTRFVDRLASTEASIDHFATSLPQLLLFVRPANDDRDDLVAVLRAQLELLSGQSGTDGPALREARARVPHHLVLWWSARLAGSR